MYLLVIEIIHINWLHVYQFLSRCNLKKELLGNRVMFQGCQMPPQWFWKNGERMRKKWYTYEIVVKFEQRTQPRGKAKGEVFVFAQAYQISENITMCRYELKEDTVNYVKINVSNTTSDYFSNHYCHSYFCFLSTFKKRECRGWANVH